LTGIKFAGRLRDPGIYLSILLDNSSGTRLKKFQ